VHAAKATARPAVNAASAGTGAPVVSVIEDAVAAATSLAALLVPVLVALMLVVIVGLLLWMRLRRRPRG
jgi:hypothetical protein